MGSGMRATTSSNTINNPPHLGQAVQTPYCVRNTGGESLNARKTYPEERHRSGPNYRCLPLEKGDLAPKSSKISLHAREPRLHTSSEFSNRFTHSEFTVPEIL